jgi:A/G-specific adenine glycosylase
VWQRHHGRHCLPWQGADAYHVWLSEVMLQQTQVATVIPYYQRFIHRFPTIATLATANEDDVLAHWSGLGYYSRARNLYRAAKHIVEQHNGIFPRDFDAIVALPGIGRSTAAAISAFVFHERCAILDGNVKRVLARYCAIEGHPSQKEVEQKLWQRAEALLPEKDIATYTQGLMDLGAMICTRSKPDCAACPVNQDCLAHTSNRVAQFPAPRPRKAIPEKYSTFLLLQSAAGILLEKRPAIGIWGGLWSLPQLESGEMGDAAAYCEQRFGVTVATVESLPTFIHTFTHFKLHISPLLLQVARRGEQISEPGSQWFTPTAALNAALPTPVRKLIEGLGLRCPPSPP